jgi:hypothetical protein
MALPLDSRLCVDTCGRSAGGSGLVVPGFSVSCAALRTGTYSQRFAYSTGKVAPIEFCLMQILIRLTLNLVVC